MPQILCGPPPCQMLYWDLGGAGVTDDGDLGPASEGQSLLGEKRSQGAKKMLVPEHPVFARDIPREGSGYFCRQLCSISFQGFY